jgi:hypothetical protein
LATSNFTLTRNVNGDWQGKTTNPVKVQVVPVGATPITISDAYYNAVKVAKIAADTATVSVIAGANDLRVSIQPMAYPAVVWSLVEVGADGTPQVLDTVNEFLPAQNPFGTAIRIIGVTQ